MLEGFVPWPDEFVEKYRKQNFWEDITLGEHFDNWVALYSKRPAIVYQGEEISYKQMGIYVDRLAYHLTQMGLKTYDPVVFTMLNVPEMIYLLYACFKIGAIPICALPLHRWNEISFFAKKTNARALAVPDRMFMDFDFGELSKKIQDTYPNVEFILSTNDRDGNMVPVSDLVQEEVDIHVAKERISEYKPDPMAPAVFQLSGGTTGVPKLIPRTHNDYYYNAKANAQTLEFDETIRAATAVPIIHNSGMVCGLLPTHLSGGAIVPCPLNPTSILESIEQCRANVLAAVPVFIHILLDVPDEEFAKYDISSLELLSWGGNPIPPDIQMKFRERFNVDSIQVYGMAEGLICWTRRDDSLEIKLKTQGRPISEADEVKVVDINTGEEMPANEVGECWVRGPYTIRGYFKAEEHNRSAFTEDGFYRTGDLVRKDEKGNITVAGRIKDCISRGAEKINAEEVENHIIKFPSVNTTAVVGMPDKVFGERVCAFVVLMPGAEPFSLDRLCEFLLKEREIAKFKLPERLEFIDELPVSAVGKFEKKTLIEKIKEILKAEGSYYGEP